MATAVTMTGADFDQLPFDEGRKWELLEGELIEVPSPTTRHQRIVSILIVSLENYLGQQDSGHAVPDVEFALGASSRLRPDVAVLLADRWTSVDPDKVPVPVAPNLAIEVISPGERSNASMLKVKTYLSAGVQEVWQVYNETKSVMIYRTAKSFSMLDAEEILSTPLLPGWSLPVGELFNM